MLVLKSSQMMLLAVLFCSICRDSSLFRRASILRQKGQCDPTSCVKPYSIVLKHRILYGSLSVEDHPKEEFLGPPIAASQAPGCHIL